MDTNGARHLRRRLESHEQWRRAAAVRCGEQPTADPDADALVEFAHGFRRYRDGMSKRLVGGRWESAFDREDSAVLSEGLSGT